MAYKYYNPNPLHRFVGDCTIRAICKLTEQDWDSVYAGTVFEGFLHKNMPSGNSVWGTYLERLGYTQHVIPNAYLRGYTVRDFADEHPRGKYLLVLDEHVVTVVDGDYYDTLDPGDEIPRYYWTKGE